MAMADRVVGLYGGTFDPVHNAHLALARLACSHLGLSELRLVPSGQPWQKAGRALSAAHHRVAMLRLATAGWLANGLKVRVDTREVERAGPSYTLETVQAVQAELPAGTRLVLVIGADQHAGLHTWHHWQALLQRVHLAVAGRPGAAVPVPDVLAHPHTVLPLPEMAISASDIRQRVRAGLDIAPMVPAEVAGYIARHRLYLPDSGSEPVQVNT